MLTECWLSPLSLLVWVDLILASQIRSQMNSVFWFFWFTRWVKQLQGKILWCKRCTITLHIIQQSTRWPQPVNILDCIDWPSLHMSPSRPLADKCLLAILTQHKWHSFFKLLGIWCVAFNFRVDFLSSLRCFLMRHLCWERPKNLPFNLSGNIVIV